MIRIITKPNKIIHEKSCLNCKKKPDDKPQICFVYIFPIFHIFSIPKSKFRCVIGNVPTFLESKPCFLLLSYSFFHFSIPKTKFRCNWGKMGLDPLTNTCFPLFSYILFTGNRTPIRSGRLSEFGF